MKNWRKTRDYRIWRVTVIRRDKVCFICKSRKNRQAHHIKNGAYFPALRFDPKNGKCMCMRCHIDAFHSKFMGGTRKKCTEKDLQRFTKLLSIYLTNLGLEI